MSEIEEDFRTDDPLNEAIEVGTDITGVKEPAPDEAIEVGTDITCVKEPSPDEAIEVEEPGGMKVELIENYKLKGYFNEWSVDTTVFNFDLDDVIIPWTRLKEYGIIMGALEYDKDLYPGGGLPAPEIARSENLGVVGPELPPEELARKINKLIPHLIDFIRHVVDTGYRINITSFSENYTGKIYELLKLLDIKCDNIIVCNNNVCNHYLKEIKGSAWGKTDHIILANLLRNGGIKRSPIEISGNNGGNGLSVSSKKSPESEDNYRKLKEETKDFSMGNQILFDDDGKNILYHDGPCVWVMAEHPFKYFYLPKGDRFEEALKLVPSGKTKANRLPRKGSAGSSEPAEFGTPKVLGFRDEKRPPHMSQTPGERQGSTSVTPSVQRAFNFTPGTDSPGKPSRSVTKGPQKSLFGSPSSELSSPKTPSGSRKKTKKKKRKKTKKKKKKKKKSKGKKR